MRNSQMGSCYSADGGPRAARDPGGLLGQFALTRECYTTSASAK